MVRKGIASALAAIALAALPAVAQARASREFFGIVPSSSLSQQEINMMGNGKVGTIRQKIDWKYVQPSQNSGYQWANSGYDALIGNLAARGIRTLPFVYGTPGWVGGTYEHPPIDSQQDRNAWKGLISSLVSRYGRGGSYWSGPYQSQHPGKNPKPIHIVQPWNEENSSKQYKPKPSPKGYATLVQITAAAVRSADPHAKVMLGGIFGTPRLAGGIDSWDFLRRLYKVNGIKKDFNTVAIHPYAPGLHGIRYQFKKIRKVMKSHGDGGARTRVTEIGWASKKRVGSLGRSPKGQARILRKAYHLLLRRRGSWNVTGADWYTWRDLPAGEAACDWCQYSGLVHQNLDPKPAWRAYKHLTPG